MRKGMLCVVVLATAGFVQGAIIRYKNSGDYFDTTNTTDNVNGWQSLTLPGTGDVIRCNWGGYYGNTVSLTSGPPQEVMAFQLGVDEGGHLIVGNGGSLTSRGTDGGGTKIGNNNNCQGKLTINSNGTVNVIADWMMIAGNSDVTGILEINGGVLSASGHVWCATGADSTAQITINDGTFSIGGMIGLGTINASTASGGTATFNVNGGTLALANIHPTSSIMDGSKINIALTGAITLPGDRSSTISNYVAAGKILGYGLTNNVNIDVISDAGVTNTVITPGNAAVPDLYGMDITTVSNTLDLFGFTVGSISNTYVFDVTPGTVLVQNPAAGEQAAPGTAIDLIIMEPVAAPITVDNIGSGNWMEADLWNTGVVPERETQGFKVRSFGGYTLTLTNKVAVKTLVLGDNGTAQMDVLDGGHFVGGQFGDWNAVGYNGATTLNVYTGGIFEARGSLLYGWGGGGSGSNDTCYMNIDGGSVMVGGWMSIGVNGYCSTETTVMNGGHLEFARFRDDMVNGVIYLYEGTIQMHDAWRIIDLQGAINAGRIVIAPGYEYSISDSTGHAVLTGFRPGYPVWAATFLPTVIGSETDDYDEDGQNNFTEYVLKGNPMNPAVLGVEPLFVDVGASFQYTHVIRNDDPNLTYQVETTEDLTTPFTAYTNILGTNYTGTAYDEVINEIPKTANQTFIRLKVEQK